MNVSELVQKFFGEEKVVWFDYSDYIKSNKFISQKGIAYKYINCLYEIYIVSEDCDEILIDVLQEHDTYKFESIVKIFYP